MLAAAAFLSGLLFGGVGVVASAIGAGAGDLLAGGGAGGALSAALRAAVLAAVPYAVFRTVHGLGRGLPNLRSYLWLVGSAALAAVAASLVGWGIGGGGTLLTPWTEAFGGVAAICFTAPIAVLAADLRWRRWMAPIRHELPARRSITIAPIGRLDTRGVGSATRVIDVREPRLGRSAALVGAAIVVVTALVVPLVAVLESGGDWTLLLYLLPILWAAGDIGMRGAVAAASLCALTFVLGHALWSLAVGDPALAGALPTWRSAYTELLLFGLLGAVAGTARERESALRSEVVLRNHLLRRDLLRVVQALTSAVEAKDVYTEGHLRRVSEHAVRVGEALGLNGPALEMVFFASMLHDIGKIGVPEAILLKPGPLTPEETRLMQRHAEVGARILENLDVLRDAAPLVLHHQERWDGRQDGFYPGYPAGLSGETIPLGSRIIAVVDAFDAMTTDRPYRDALPVEEAKAELLREAGRQFDPRVVEAFLAGLEEHPWRRRTVQRAPAAAEPGTNAS